MYFADKTQRAHGGHRLFPVDLPAEPAKERIRKLAEELDAHRKRVQAQHPDLTLTGLYNVLEKLRADQPLTDKERSIHDRGLVSKPSSRIHPSTIQMSPASSELNFLRPFAEGEELG